MNQLGVVSVVKKPFFDQTRLERAINIALAFVETQRVMWASTWPAGHCMNSALLLAPMLRVPLNSDYRVIYGLVHARHKHAWVESPDGDIIDPTYGAFPREEPLRVLAAREATILGHAGELQLTLEQEENFRRCLKPGSPLGWTEDSGIWHLFNDRPWVKS